MIEIAIIYDIFRPNKRRQMLKRDWAGLTIGEALRRCDLPKSRKFAAIVNGNGPLREEKLEAELKDGDQVVFAPDYGVTMLLVSLAVSLVMAAVSYFVFKPDIQDDKPKARQGEDEVSPTYTWRGMGTTYGAGYRIPIIYGIHRAGGQCIGRDFWAEITKEQNGDYTFYDHMRLLLSFCEGPIYGFGEKDDSTVPGGKNVSWRYDTSGFRTGIPEGLFVEGNSYTGSKDSAEARFGFIHQAPLLGWTGSWTLFSFESELKQGKAVEYTTNGDHVGSVKFRIRFDALYGYQNGKYIEKEVKFKVQFRKHGSQWWGPAIYFPIKAKFKSSFHWQIEIGQDKLITPGQYEFKIERITAPDQAGESSRSVWVGAMEGNYYEPNNAIGYPGLALLSVDIAASEKLTRPSPNITVPIYGRMIEWYDQSAGAWQGPEFYNATNQKWVGRNPAWVLIDFLTNSRGGGGSYLSKDDLELQTFYDWADYCDEQVDDGSGTGAKETRCYCDLVIDSGASFWDTVLQICRTGDAVPYFSGNKLAVRWMHSKTRIQVFATSNMANTTVTFTDKRQRPNVIDVQYLNAAENWEQDIQSIDDPEAPGAYNPYVLEAEPLRRQVIKLYGVTRQSQAMRAAWLRHAMNKYQKYIIDFDCAVDALAAEVGDIIGIQTDVIKFFMNDTESFRAANQGASSTMITLDKDYEFDGGTYELIVVDTNMMGQVRTITPPAGTLSAGTPITLSSSASWAISAPVAIGKTTGETVRDFEITSITLNEDLTRHVTAVSYDPDGYNYTEPRAWMAPIPTGASENNLSLPGTGILTIAKRNLNGDTELAWTPPDGLERQPVRVYLKPADGYDWRLYFEGFGQSCVIEDLIPGVTYKACICCDSITGKSIGPSDDAAQEFTAEEFPDVVPGNVANFQAVETDEGILLSWDPAAGEGLSHYEVRMAATIAAESWLGAETVATTRETSILVSAPKGDFTFYIRAVNIAGAYSGEASTVTATRGERAGEISVLDNDMVTP